MKEQRLLSKLKAGKLALGILLRRGPYIVDHLKAAGFDWFQNDQMHGGLDWAEAEHMVNAARAAGLTPILRVNSMPWGSNESDPHLPAEVARAISLGYEAVKWSYSSIEEVKQCAKMAFDWHRNVNPHSAAELLEAEKENKGSILIMPAVESLEAIKSLEEVVSVEGIRSIFISMTDTSRVLGHPYDGDHPDVLRVLDKAVSIAKKKGAWIGCNTGYIRGIENNIKRVKKMHEHGVDFVMIQNVGYLVDWASNAIIDGVRAELGYSS